MKERHRDRERERERERERGREGERKGIKLMEKVKGEKGKEVKRTEWGDLF